MLELISEQEVLVQHLESSKDNVDDKLSKVESKVNEELGRD